MELHHNIQPVSALKPQNSAATTPIVSALIDRQGSQGATEFVLDKDTGAALTVTMTDGALANGSDQTAVGSSLILDALPAPGTAAGIFNFGYVGGQRYVQVTITPAANTSTNLGLTALLTYMRGLPAGNVQI